MQLRATTKMAIQAAISIAIAEFINLYFNFERGYWIALTAMAVTTQTWGESVKRSFERIGMTILGGAVGTTLYFFLPLSQPVIISLLLIFIFFTVYMAKVNNLLFVFFLTCFVVFLFALLGDWDWYLLKLRIIDTTLGAIIAMIVGFFFFPLKTNVTDLFIAYLEKMSNLLERIFCSPAPPENRIASQYLTADLQRIKKEALAIRFQLLFHRLNALDFVTLLRHVECCTQWMCNLMASYRLLFPHLSAEELTTIRTAAYRARENINVIIRGLREQKPIEMTPGVKVSSMIKQVIEQDPKHFSLLEGTALGFYSLMYFFSQLHRDLGKICALVERE